MKRLLIYLTAILLVGGASPFILAQPFGPAEGGFAKSGPGDGSRLIHQLNRALTRAGAGELAATQETAVVDLVREHWANRPVPDSNFDLYQEYGAAILDGDAVAAKRIAEQLAEVVAARTALRLKAQADFQIALLAILDTSQLEALQAQYGDQGILRLLSGPGRMGSIRKARGEAAGFSRQRMRPSPETGTTGP